MNNEKLKCSICGKTIETNYFGWAYGNNAWPINNGRCCDICNDFVVIPARIKNINNLQKTKIQIEKNI